MPPLRRYGPTKLCDGAEMVFLATFLRPVFAASRVQRISDLHTKFALRPHHVPKDGKHPLGEEKKEEEEERRNSMKIYMVSLLYRATIN